MTAKGTVIGAACLVLALAGRASGQGAELYRALCASCHGVTGAGDGPAADALTPRPTDLRRSTLEERELMRVIDGRRSVRAHGSASMPVWGRVLESEREGEPHAGRTTLLEVQVLADFVRRLRTSR